NTDDQDVHDLVLEGGVDSGRLSPGESATIDVGVVGEDLDGWCSIAGHRQMGMVFAVDVTGAGPEAGGPDDQDSSAEAGHEGMDHGGHAAADGGSDSAADDLDFMADPGPD